MRRRTLRLENLEGRWCPAAGIGMNLEWVQDYSPAQTSRDDCNGHGTHVAGTVGGSQATNFDRISSDLKSAIGQVDSTAGDLAAQQRDPSASLEYNFGSIDGAASAVQG